MSISPVSTAKVQTCPHGLSPGACPICNPMGGGGGSRKKADPAPKNEMSYGEMYAIWMRMKAADKRKLDNENNLKRETEVLKNTKEALSAMADKLVNVLNKIENMLPRPIASLFNATVNNILKPIINIIKNFPNFVENVRKFIQNIQKEVYIAAEKLASVFGEIKNFVQKQVSDNFKKFTKKVYKILNIFGLRDGEDELEEDEKVNAEITAFKAKDVVSIKEFLISLTRTERKPKDDDINTK